MVSVHWLLIIIPKKCGLLNLKKNTMQKKIFFYVLLLTVFITVVISGCIKNTEEYPPQNRDFTSGSLVQVYMAMVNANRNYVYVNSIPLNGASIATGGLFPSSAYASSVPSGVTAFLVRDTLRTSTQQQLSFAENLQQGRLYTIFVYDTISSPKQKTVETVVVVPSDTSARLRFANFVYSKNAVPAVDIFSKRKAVNLFTNVPVTEVTGFISVSSNFNDTLYVRETGTANQLAALNGINPTAKRSYTIVFRGSYASSSSRTLSSFANY